MVSGKAEPMCATTQSNWEPCRTLRSRRSETHVSVAWAASSVATTASRHLVTNSMRADVGGHESHAGSASWSCIPLEEEVDDDEDPCVSFDEYFADRSPRTVRAHCATCEALKRTYVFLKSPAHFRNVVLRLSHQYDGCRSAKGARCAATAFSIRSAASFLSPRAGVLKCASVATSAWSVQVGFLKASIQRPVVRVT